jgi:hypothetical protein
MKRSLLQTWKLPRPTVGTFVLALLSVLGFVLLLTQLLSLAPFWPRRFMTGYALLTGVLVLFAFHIRKKLPSLPLGRISVWLKAHVMIGYFVIAIFALHVGWHWPRGFVDTCLYALFVIVSASGLYGVFISRVIPRQLSSLSEEFVFEQIPAIRAENARQAREMVLQAAESSQVLCELYRERLADFLERPRGMWYYIYPTRIRRHALMAELSDARRYLSVEHRTVADRLATLLRRKDELDYHAAMQGRLKLWMFVHIGFSYSLIVMALFHTWLVHAYHGGWR